MVLNDDIKELGADAEELNSEEEEEIYSDDEENQYDTESSDIDDSELLKRLDAKYGKLPQHDDEDDIDPTWTST